MYVPSSELGLSHPLSRQRVCPFPRNQRWGHIGGGGGEGLGESQFRRLEKRLTTLPTLWGKPLRQMNSAKPNPKIYENRICIFKKSGKSSIFFTVWIFTMAANPHALLSTRPHILILKSGREVYLELNIILSLEPQA